MPTDKERTACCGLYCGDCIPSNRALFDAAQEFREELEKCRFGEYAQYKSKGDKSFDRYGTLQEVLSAILSLQCSKTCFHGGGRSDCPTRACVRGKGMEGCWQGTGFETCSLLEPMSACHGDTVKHNLRMIRQFGVEDWADAQLETAKPTEISHC